MYIESNNYNVFDYQFFFPIEKWNWKIKIDCNNWGVLYPVNDVNQWIACQGTGIIQENIFSISENQDLILENYLTNEEVSFWQIEISENIIKNENLFSSKDTMQEFYILQWWIILWILLFIFMIKFNKKMLWKNYY